MAKTHQNTMWMRPAASQTLRGCLPAPGPCPSPPHTRPADPPAWVWAAHSSAGLGAPSPFHRLQSWPGFVDLHPEQGTMASDGGSSLASFPYIGPERISPPTPNSPPVSLAFKFSQRFSVAKSALFFTYSVAVLCDFQQVPNLFSFKTLL